MKHAESFQFSSTHFCSMETLLKKPLKEHKVLLKQVKLIALLVVVITNTKFGANGNKQKKIHCLIVTLVILQVQTVSAKP